MLTFRQNTPANRRFDGGNAMSDTSAQRYVIPTLGSLYAACELYALPLLRVVLGAILVPHGCQKFFGWFGGPGFVRFTQIFENIGYKPGALWVTLVALTELVGGLMLVFGLFTRVAAAALVIFMINSIWFTSAKGFFWTQGGMEYSILILAAALVFLVHGGGRCSIDRSIGKEL